MASRRLIIPNYLPPSLNVLMRMHWSKANRLKKECADFVTHYAREQGVEAASEVCRVSLLLTMGPRGRRFDDDNAWKVILDALVKAGLLVDDSPKWARRGDVWWARGPQRETVVVLDSL